MNLQKYWHTHTHIVLYIIILLKIGTCSLNAVTSGFSGDIFVANRLGCHIKYIMLSVTHLLNLQEMEIIKKPNQLSGKTA